MVVWRLIQVEVFGLDALEVAVFAVAEEYVATAPAGWASGHDDVEVHNFDLVETCLEGNASAVGARGLAGDVVVVNYYLVVDPCADGV